MPVNICNQCCLAWHPAWNSCSKAWFQTSVSIWTQLAAALHRLLGQAAELQRSRHSWAILLPEQPRGPAPFTSALLSSAPCSDSSSGHGSAARRGVTPLQDSYQHAHAGTSPPNCRAGKRADTLRLCIHALRFCLLVFLLGCLQTLILVFGWLV